MSRRKEVRYPKRVLGTYYRRKTPMERSIINHEYKTHHSTASKDRTSFRTDFDVLHDNYQLQRLSSTTNDTNWEQKLAIKYEQELNKECGIIDLHDYKHGRFGIRWRTHSETNDFKGIHICGNQKCSNTSKLNSFQMPFAYCDKGNTDQKQCMIRINLCEECSFKLNYHRLKGKIKQEKKEAKIMKKEEKSKHLKIEKCEHKKSKRHKKRKKKRKYSTSESESDLCLKIEPKDGHSS